MVMARTDIRQSPNWSSYLEMYGWKSIPLSNGSILRTIPFIFFKAAKLQRPTPLNKDDLDEIDALCKKERVLQLKVFPAIGQNVSLLSAYHYKTSRSVDIPPTTMLIDLTKSIEDLEKNLSSGCRYSINRSKREGDHVDIVRNPSNELISHFFDLVSERGKRKGFYTQSLRDYKRKVEAFGNDAFIAYAYNKSGEPLGAKMYLGFKDSVWYIHGGTTEIGQKSKGGYKLLWDSILYFKELGYVHFDLEGLTDMRFKKQSKKWQGYTDFKNKFNGEVVEYPMPMSKIYLGH